MKYGALRTPFEISAAIRGIPALVSLVTSLSKQGLTSFLFGGAVRDLAAFGTVSGDFDILTIAQSKEKTPPVEVFEKLVHLWVSENKFTATMYRGDHIAISDPTSKFSTDIHYPCLKPIEKLIRSDFTINGIAFNCVSGEFHDPLSGLPDLEKGILKIHSPEYVITNPPNFPRMFRTAANLGILPDINLTTFFKRVAPCITLHENQANPRTLLETLKFFSTAAISGYVEVFCEIFITNLFPELIPLAVQEKPTTTFKQNIKRIASLDTWGKEDPKWEAFLDAPFGLGVTIRGYLRFVLLFNELGSAYEQMGKNSPYAKQVSLGKHATYADRMRHNIMLHAAKRYHGYKDLEQMLVESLALYELTATYQAKTRDPRGDEAKSWAGLSDTLRIRAQALYCLINDVPCPTQD